MKFVFIVVFSESCDSHEIVSVHAKEDSALIAARNRMLGEWREGERDWLGNTFWSDKSGLEFCKVEKQRVEEQ